MELEYEIVRLNAELDKTRETLSLLISWLAVDLGEGNVQTLLTKLNA